MKNSLFLLFRMNSYIKRGITSIPAATWDEKKVDLKARNVADKIKKEFQFRIMEKENEKQRKRLWDKKFTREKIQNSDDSDELVDDDDDEEDTAPVNANESIEVEEELVEEEEEHEDDSGEEDAEEEEVAEEEEDVADEGMDVDDEEEED